MSIFPCLSLCYFIFLFIISSPTLLIIYIYHNPNYISIYSLLYLLYSDLYHLFFDLLCYDTYHICFVSYTLFNLISTSFSYVVVCLTSTLFRFSVQYQLHSLLYSAMYHLCSVLCILYMSFSALSHILHIYLILYSFAYNLYTLFSVLSHIFWIRCLSP